MKTENNAIVSLILTLIVMGVSVYQHEAVHVAAFEYLGYDNNTVTYGFLESNTRNYDMIAPEDRNIIYLANIQNEAIAYNLNPYLGMALYLLTFLVLEVTSRIGEIKKDFKRVKELEKKHDELTVLVMGGLFRK